MDAGSGEGEINQAKAPRTEKGHQKSKLSWYIKAPFRALCRARDFYVRSLTGCAGRGGVGVYPGAAVPRSYSFHTARSSASDEDYRELMRASSQGKLGALNQMQPVRGGATGAAAPGGGGGVVPRSQSVACGRIDEDKPLELDGDVRLGVGPMYYPRSRSCAVPSKNRIGVVA